MLQDLPDLLEWKACQDLREERAHKDLLDHWDPVDLMVLQDPLVSPVSAVCLEREDLTDLKDHSDHQDPVARLVLVVLQEDLVRQGPRVRKDRRESAVVLDLPDLLVLPDH